MPSSFVPTVTAITTSQDLQWLVQPTLISSMAQSQGQPLGSQPPAVDPYDMPGTSYSTPGISGYSSGGASGSGGPSTSGTTSGPGPARPSRARPRRPREETVSKRHQNFIWGEETREAGTFSYWGEGPPRPQCCRNPIVLATAGEDRRVLCWLLGLLEEEEVQGGRTRCTMFPNLMTSISPTQLTPEEEEKRRVRRERNKLAAAKCRNRRRELTDRLQAVRMAPDSGGRGEDTLRGALSPPSVTPTCALILG